MPPPLFNVFSIPPPPPFPPTPSPPPPWYALAENCIPIVTAAESDVEIPSSQIERSVCVYVRSIQDERVRADRCFASIGPSPPPPPPTPESRLAAINSKLLARRVRQGGTNSAEQSLPVDSFDAYNREAQLKQQQQLEYLEKLSDDNFQLRELLGTVIDKIEGRRLWQRSEAHASHHLEDNILVNNAFGLAPLQGVTTSECQALCDAIDGNNGTCVAIAYARLNADPRAGFTLRQCYLLRGIGGCTAGSFSAALFARRGSDGCTAPTAADNPLCVQLASSRTDLRVITYDEATSICRHGKGRAKLAYPRTMLEAFSYLGYARERGVHAFWSDKPPEGGLMVWTGLDGERLNVTAGERRCVLVSTVDSTIHGHMYAELRPCNARLADGVVCESAQAARKLAHPSPYTKHYQTLLCVRVCTQLHRHQEALGSIRRHRLHRRRSPSPRRFKRSPVTRSNHSPRESASQASSILTLPNSASRLPPNCRHQSSGEWCLPSRLCVSILAGIAVRERRSKIATATTTVATRLAPTRRVARF